MKYILLFVSLTSLHAHTLKELLNSAPHLSQTRISSYQTQAKIAQQEAQLANAMPTLAVDMGSAQDIFGNEGGEYMVSFSQQLQAPFAFSAKNQALHARTKALQASHEHSLRAFKLELALLYHQGCVDYERITHLNTLLDGEEKAHSALQEAFNLGEIARTSLLFYHMEHLKHQALQAQYATQYQATLSALQAYVPTVKTLACTDMMAPSATPEINTHTPSYLHALEYEAQSYKSQSDVEQSWLSSLTYGISYAHEIDKTRLGAQLSLPLGTLSTQKEAKRTQALYTKQALQASYETLKAQIDVKTATHQRMLKEHFKRYEMYTKEMLPLAYELETLTRLALLEGEASVMESLDATRSYLTTFLEMLENKRAYYDALFALFTLTDTTIGD